MPGTAQNNSAASPAAEQITAENLVSDSPADTTSATTAQNEPPKSLLDTVKDALAETKTNEEAAASGGEQSPSSEGGTEEEQSAAPAGTEDQEGADTKQSKGKGYDARIKQLVTERDGFKERAGQWDQFSAWAKESGLQAEDLSNSLALARMVKQSPHEALTVLRAVVSDLEKQTGHELPEDLKAKVENGLIDEETARELSVGRSKVSMTEAQQRQQAEQRAAATEFQGRQELAAFIGKSVTDLEKSLESTDPDYPKIKGLVKSKVVELMHSEGVPGSANDAVAQVKRAVAAVKADLSGVLPQRRSTNPVPTGSTPGQSGAKPTSSLEAARMALNGQAPRY